MIIISLTGITIPTCLTEAAIMMDSAVGAVAPPSREAWYLLYNSRINLFLPPFCIHTAWHHRACVAHPPVSPEGRVHLHPPSFCPVTIDQSVLATERRVTMLQDGYRSWRCVAKRVRRERRPWRLQATRSPGSMNVVAPSHYVPIRASIPQESTLTSKMVHRRKMHSHARSLGMALRAASMGQLHTPTRQ